MAKPVSSATTKPMPPELLARMVGTLGDAKTVAKLCGEFGAILAQALPPLLKTESGHDVTIAFAGSDTGTMDELVHRLGTSVAISDASLRNWCPHFVLGCDSPIIIAMMESLLGALPDAVTEPEPRALSAIEIDIAAMLFENIGEVVRMAVGLKSEPVIVRPCNDTERPKPDATAAPVFAAAVTMTMGLGPVLSTFSVIVPQAVLLKTKFLHAPPGQPPKPEAAHWTDQLREQVQRSSVTLNAHIRLERMTLDAISRLQVGDVLMFQDTQDVRVDVSANGRELYICEFGRAGSRYTVRVKDTYGSEEDLLSHITS